MLARVAPPLTRALIEFDRNGFAPFVARFAARDWLRGRRIEIIPDGLTGVADGVASDGTLRVVDDDGALHLVVSGEASVRLADSPRR